MAETAGASWLLEYAVSRDPVLRERIILAYLGLADRLAARYRHGRGTTPENLTQTARAGLIAAVDRYDPAKSPSFVPLCRRLGGRELKRYLRDTTWRLHVPRPAKEQVLVPGDREGANQVTGNRWWGPMLESKTRNGGEHKMASLECVPPSLPTGSAVCAVHGC